MDIRNGENELNQGLESSFYCPSKKKIWYVYICYAQAKNLI